MKNPSVTNIRSYARGINNDAFRLGLAICQLI